MFRTNLLALVEKTLLAIALASLAGCGPVSFIGEGKDAVKVQPAPGAGTTTTFTITPTAPAPSGS